MGFCCWVVSMALHPFLYHHTAPTQDMCSSWQTEAEIVTGIYALLWEAMGLMAETWASVMASSVLRQNQLA